MVHALDRPAELVDSRAIWQGSDPDAVGICSGEFEVDARVRVVWRDTDAASHTIGELRISSRVSTSRIVGKILGGGTVCAHRDAAQCVNGVSDVSRSVSRVEPPSPAQLARCPFASLAGRSLRRDAQLALTISYSAVRQLGPIHKGVVLPAVRVPVSCIKVELDD